MIVPIYISGLYSVMLLECSKGLSQPMAIDAAVCWPKAGLEPNSFYLIEVINEVYPTVFVVATLTKGLLAMLKMLKPR